VSCSPIYITDAPAVGEVYTIAIGPRFVTPKVWSLYVEAVKFDTVTAPPFTPTGSVIEHWLNTSPLVMFFTAISPEKQSVYCNCPVDVTVTE